MPVHYQSRYRFTRGVTASDGTTVLTDREPYRQKTDPRNRLHRVSATDTLHSLAQQYFPSVRSAADLWWLIADYQDPPIIDPTLKLNPATILVIPPESVVFDLFSEERRDTETLV